MVIYKKRKVFFKKNCNPLPTAILFAKINCKNPPNGYKNSHWGGFVQKNCKKIPQMAIMASFKKYVLAMPGCARQVPGTTWPARAEPTARVTPTRHGSYEPCRAGPNPLATPTYSHQNRWLSSLQSFQNKSRSLLLLFLFCLHHPKLTPFSFASIIPLGVNVLRRNSFDNANNNEIFSSKRLVFISNKRSN